MNDTSAHLERTAASLFGATSVVAALVVGAMLVSGWHAGSLDNRIEWLFWAGAIFGATGIGCLGSAAFPSLGQSGDGVRLQRRAAAIRAGLILFMGGPVLCVVAVFTDYWI